MYEISLKSRLPFYMYNVEFLKHINFCHEFPFSNSVFVERNRSKRCSKTNVVDHVDVVNLRTRFYNLL